MMELKSLNTDCDWTAHPIKEAQAERHESVRDRTTEGECINGL
jgi:hypothetical protein